MRKNRHLASLMELRKISQKEFISESAESTFNWGVDLGRSLSPGQVLTLTGDLGAGKTTLVKGIAQGFLQIDPHAVTSPTFTYLNIYENQARFLCHFDLYRLNNCDAFLALGFQDYITPHHLCCIEWPEKLPLSLVENPIHITLYHLEEGKRRILCEKIPV